MAIVSCPNCNEPIYSDTPTCPHCKKKTNQVDVQTQLWQQRQIRNSEKSAERLNQKNISQFQNQPLPQNGSITQRQIIGFIGSLILFVGVFTPILTVPVIGSVNYFQNGTGDGVIILILAAISFFLTLVHKYKGLLITGILSLGLLAFTFISFQLKMSETRSKMKSDLVDNPFKDLGDAMLSSVQISWGWAVLIIGASFLIIAAMWKGNSYAVIENDLN